MPPSDRERGYLFPAVIDPPQISVCVPVPDDVNHRRAFLAALNELARPHSWQWDGGVNPSGPALVWADIFDVVSARLGAEMCDSEPINCREYTNTAPFIQYFPNDPRFTPDLIPAGYLFPPWYFATAASNLTYGTFPGDIVTSLDRFPPGSLPTILPASGLPRCRVNVNVIGGAEVRVYIRNMVAGSLVQSTVDDDIFTISFWDVTKDLISIPAETGDQVIFEHVFATGGAHHIDLIVVPKANDEIPFIFHGAAIEHVEICGEIVHVPTYNLTCADGVIQLLADGVPVDTIDLAVCYPHPSVSPHPDWTLNRNNGDLQLLKDGVLHDSAAYPDWTLNRNNGDLQLLRDGVLHDSAAYPNYNTSYNQTLHLLELFRDSLIVDTTPLPSYTLVKPSDDVIQLNRNAIIESIIEDKFLTYRLQENGNQHELTEDTIVVSSVTDEVSAGGDEVTHFEAEWDLTLPRTGTLQPRWMSDAFGSGIWVHEAGYVSELVGGNTQELDIWASFNNLVEVTRIRVTYLVAAGAEGDFSHYALHPSSGINYYFPGGFGTASGPETKVFDMLVNWRWNTNQSIIFLYHHDGGQAGELVTMQKVEVMGVGWPRFNTFADVTEITMFNELNEAWQI